MKAVSLEISYLSYPDSNPRLDGVSESPASSDAACVTGGDGEGAMEYILDAVIPTALLPELSFVLPPLV